MPEILIGIDERKNSENETLSSAGHSDFNRIAAGAQTIPMQKLNATKTTKEADYLYNIGSYYNAEEYYQAELKLKPDNAYATYQIAMCNYFMRDYQTAEDNFRKIIGTKADAFPLSRILLRIDAESKCKI